MPALAQSNAVLIRQTALENSFICQPQNVNVAGTIFGGFLSKCNPSRKNLLIAEHRVVSFCSAQSVRYCARNGLHICGFAAFFAGGMYVAWLLIWVFGRTDHYHVCSG